MPDLLTLLGSRPTESTPHERDARRHLLDRVATAVAATTGVLALIHAGLGWSRWPTTLVLALMALGCLLARAQSRTGRHRDAALLLVLILLVGGTAALATGRGLRDGGTAALALLVVVGGLLAGRRRIPLVFAATVACTLLLADLHDRGRIADEGPVPLIELVTLLSVLVSGAVITGGLLRVIELHLAEIRRADEERLNTYEITLAGWARVLELKDEETEGHSRRVTTLAVELARAMGLDDERIAHVRRGALLHDIGKLAVPDAILRKPGPLTPEEREIVERHPGHAHEMLRDIPFLEPALPIPYLHHERWDGTGYPRGLRGEDIPLEARMFSVVDVWEALTSDRPYRRAWPVARANAYVAEHAGTLFDPRVVEAFLALLDRRPELVPAAPPAIAAD